MGASGDRKTAQRAAPSRSRVACALIAGSIAIPGDERGWSDPLVVRVAGGPWLDELLEKVLVEMLERRRREAAPITPTADRACRSYFLDVPGAGSSGPYQAGEDL